MPTNIVQEYDGCPECGKTIIAAPLDEDTDCHCRRCEGCLILLGKFEGLDDGLCNNGCYEGLVDID